MSNEGSAGSSSNSSSSQLSFFQDNVSDLALYGSPAPTFVRTGTVVRRSTVPFRKDRVESTSSTEDDDAPSDKFRRDTPYRHSLAAISERRSARSSLRNEQGQVTHRNYSSIDSSSGSASDCRTKSDATTDTPKAEPSLSPNNSSYYSWIESVNSEYFGSATSTVPAEEDVDNKVGEWNNFWLNYSNARLKHLATEQTFSSDGGVDRVGDYQSDEGKSEGSTQHDVTDKNSVECVLLTVEEMQETVRCSQKIAEILQNAMKRCELDGGSSNESYYSQQISAKTPVREEMPMVSLIRERSISCVEPQIFQRQKQVLKPSQQSSSTSCIDAILKTGVADIFKKVISKKRDIVNSSNEAKSTARSSFSEWTSGR